jgi:hypothetical protein
VLSCRDATRLYSESLDRRLPLNARLGMRVHLIMCAPCARFSRQIRLLRAIVRKASSDLQEAGEGLSPEASARLEAALEVARRAR